MATLGYVRVSSETQNVDRQIAALTAAGVDRDAIYIDKLSGKDTKRPQLTFLVKALRTGDVLIVHSLDRLGRSLTDLLSIVEKLTERGVTIRFLKENLTFDAVSSSASSSRFLLSIFGAVAEFERAIIRERQAEGIALAKKRGAFKGRKKVLTKQEANRLREMASVGTSKKRLAQLFGIGLTTVYRYIATSDTERDDKTDVLDIFKS